MHQGTQEIWRKCGEQSLMGCWAYRLRSAGGVVHLGQRAASSWWGTTYRRPPNAPPPSELSKKIAPQFSEANQLAETEGFEPSVMLPPRLISSQVHSTTLPPLLHSPLRLVTAANSISSL